ncbi:MAG: AAA family ATPase [Planctomycetaceae bacterium]|nr:AAA family ATPase [Planctomycetaceae bacterium]
MYIKNYRNLKELKIDSLEQVNLFTGKNNTGKSSILEAASIYANRAGLDCIFSCWRIGEKISKETKQIMIIL